RDWRYDDMKAAEEKILSQLSINEADRATPRMDPYTATVDSLFPIYKAEQRAAAKGLKVDVQSSPYIWARLFGGWVGKAKVFLEHEGPFDFYTYKNVGPSLKAILEPVRGEIDSFRAFLAAARSVELEGIRGMQSGIDQEAARFYGRNAPKL